MRFLILISLFLIPTFLFSQVDTAWVRRYNGPIDSTDIAYAIAVDNSGNVYVTGTSYYSRSASYDYVTIKYSPDGETLWVRRYNGSGNYDDYAYALAVDNLGNVYVTGESYGSGTNYDYVTIKYSPNGDELWIKKYNGPGNSLDYACAIAVDNSGNVYVTGGSEGVGTEVDYTTIKYDSQGNELWISRYNGPGNSWDFARAIAVDNSGNVYVTGESYGPGANPDYATIKYDSLGNELWVRRYNGPRNGWDYACALAIDITGNICVTGYSEYDYATIKYDTQGNELWIERYNNFIDVAVAIAVDNLNNVYVTGHSMSSGANADYTTIKYDSLGNELWVRRYDGPVNSRDYACAIAVDNSGNVYVTGGSEGSGTNIDYATIKYSPEGDELWVKRYNGPGNGMDEATAIVVDASGNVYVTGKSSGTNTSYDYATIKYIQEQPGINEKKMTKKEKVISKGTKKIYDITGKLVKENKLKKGVYFKLTEKDKEKILILK